MTQKTDLDNSHGVATKCQTTSGRPSSEGNRFGPCPHRASSPGSRGRDWGDKEVGNCIRPEGSDGSKRISPEPGALG